MSSAFHPPTDSALNTHAQATYALQLLPAGDIEGTTAKRAAAREAEAML
jgi:hypothetical protein